MNTPVRLQNITKSFGDRTVLRDLSLTFLPGAVTCVTGPSGCGKTTLLRLLAGLETPDAGTVEGTEGKAAFVFQEDRLCEDHSVLGNIRLVTGKSMSPPEIRRHLAEVGLEEAADRPVRELSGGMKRRVAIVRAVCYPADLVLLDEPFGGLDSALRTRVMTYVSERCRGRTLILVTHDLSEAAFLGASVIRLG